MRTTSAIAVLAVAALVSTVGAAAQGGAMAKPTAMAGEKTYAGCVTAGAMAGSFTLTHASEEPSMAKGTMAKESMAKEPMAKDTMAMTQTLSIASTVVDLSRHVGHQVSVTVAERAMANSDAMSKDTMAKPGAMAAPAPPLEVRSLRMVAPKCVM